MQFTDGLSAKGTTDKVIMLEMLLRRYQERKERRGEEKKREKRLEQTFMCSLLLASLTDI